MNPCGPLQVDHVSYSHGSRTGYQKDHKLGCAKYSKHIVLVQKFQAAAALILNDMFALCLHSICHIAYITLIYAHVAPPKKICCRKKLSPSTRLWGCLSSRPIGHRHRYFGAWILSTTQCFCHDSSSLSWIAPPSRNSTWRQLQLNIQPKWLPFALYPHFLFPLKLAFNLLSSFVWKLFSGIGCITKVSRLFFSQTLSVGIFAPGLVSLARHWHAMLGRSGNVVGPWLARCLEIMGTYSKSVIGGMRVSYHIPPGYVVNVFESRVTKVLNSSKESDPSNGKHTTDSCQWEKSDLWL